MRMDCWGFLSCKLDFDFLAPSWQKINFLLSTNSQLFSSHSKEKNTADFVLFCKLCMQPILLTFHYLPTFSVMTTQVAINANYWVREGDTLAWSMMKILAVDVEGASDLQVSYKGKSTFWWGNAALVTSTATKKGLYCLGKTLLTWQDPPEWARP